ncbi:MAG: hypothetical protein U0798_08570 [Gemmataceae bacterium]
MGPIEHNRGIRSSGRLAKCPRILHLQRTLNDAGQAAVIVGRCQNERAGQFLVESEIIAVADRCIDPLLARTPGRWPIVRLVPESTPIVVFVPNVSSPV